MRPHLFVRVFNVAALAVLLAPTSLSAQPALPRPLPPRGDVAPTKVPLESEWQAVISAQIQAFRDQDGATALSLAGAGFKRAYADPARFYADIVRSGYAPLVFSRSHSFGEFSTIGDSAAVQIVKFVGPDQRLYHALFWMAEEPDGWRVQSVELRLQQGIGV